MNTFFFCLPLLLAGPTPPGQESHLSSTHASYNGSALVLEGHVLLDHALGALSAEKALLQKQEEGKDFPFSFIHLTKDVLLQFKTKAELRCQEAQLDFSELTGQLHSSDGVLYKDLLRPDTSHPIPLELSGLHVDLTFSKQEAPQQKATYSILSLLAKEQVKIHYDKEFTLEADEATFQQDPSLQKQGGILEAYPTKMGTSCRLSYQGEQVIADRIHIATEQNILSLTHPEGTLPSRLLSEENQGSLSFQAEHLTWDHAKGVLFLKNQAKIQESSLGSLYAQKEMVIKQGKAQGKMVVEAVQIEGLSHLVHTTGEQVHSLTCLGSLQVDGLKGQVLATSPKNSQLCYKDTLLSLHADRALLEYSEETYEPISLTLRGHIKIQSLDPNAPRYALADRLLYALDTKTVILSSSPGKRVLFQDATQGIEMSAREVHLTEDLSTGQMQAKGVGDVKLSLSSEEKALFQTMFSSSKE